MLKKNKNSFFLTGYTLPEILVALTIIIALIAIFIAQYGFGETQRNLQNSVSKITQEIRRVQQMTLAGEGFEHQETKYPIPNGERCSGGNDPIFCASNGDSDPEDNTITGYGYGYGIKIDEAEDFYTGDGPDRVYSYKIYANYSKIVGESEVGKFTLDESENGGGDILIKTGTLSPGIFIEDILINDVSIKGVANKSGVVIFYYPDYPLTFVGDNVNQTTALQIKIVLKNPMISEDSSSIKTIMISSSGVIEIL